MDTDRNPASGMNYLQQKQYENRSPFDCCRQRDKILNKVSNVDPGFIPTRVSKIVP